MGRPKMLGEGSEPVRGVTLTAGQVEAIRRLQAAELAAAGVEPPRAEVIRRALDAGLPVLERGDAPGAAATTAPAPPEGPSLADVLAEVRALRGELPDQVAVVEAPTVRGVSEEVGPIGLLIGAADNLDAAAALITRAAESLSVHAVDARALVDRLPGVRAAAAEVRALVRKLEGQAVAPAPVSAPRTPEHDHAGFGFIDLLIGAADRLEAAAGPIGMLERIGVVDSLEAAIDVINLISRYGLAGAPDLRDEVVRVSQDLGYLRSLRRDVRPLLVIPRNNEFLLNYAARVRSLVRKMEGRAWAPEYRVEAFVAALRALVRKIGGRAVTPAPASAPRTPEHDPAQLDIEHHAAELAGAKPEPEPEERRQVDDSLGVALAAWMTEHDVGSTVAARLMGVSQGMVSHWYLGNRRISPKNRAKVEALIAAPPPAEG